MLVSASLRLAVLRGVAVVAIGLAAPMVLAGCSQDGALDEAGATLSGRLKLAPLTEKPPAGRVTVQILPYTGLPVTIADSIYRRFRAGAPAAGIELVHRLEEPATYRVQGHFVALGHASSTTILYSYDIYDAAGTPIHRIVGQDVATGVDGDAWGAVDGDVQTRLATRSLRALQAWLNRVRS